MSRFFRTVFPLLLTAALLTGDIPCHAASQQVSPPNTSAAAYVLLDADSGRVLAAQRETEERAIASTTKIMTALVALERRSLTDRVTVRREHLIGGSSMYLSEGETLTMEALLYGLMLPSGNDAAACIADVCGGQESFVRRMNEKAAELGMTHTAFQNPSGLDAAGHHSCALDMARLMACAMDEPTFARIVSARTASVGTRSMTNHNKLLGAVEGCVGGKTGYTGAAGRTLVTCAERDGLRLIAVTLHDGSDWQDHTALYDYGFANWRSERAVTRGRVYALLAVRGGQAPCVALSAAESFSYPLAAGEALTLRVELPEETQAPVREGAVLGEAVVLLDGAEVGRVGLAAANGVGAAERVRSGRRK